MPLYRAEAVVLRTHKLGEADRIITLLTRSHGLVRAVAKGVRRTSSRWGSRLEPFTHVDLQLAEGRNLDVVTQAETISPFSSHLGADYESYTAGTAMLETAERLIIEERQPSVQQFLLLVGGLRALTSGEHRAGQVLDSYLLRSLVGGRLRTLLRRLRPLRCRGPAPLVQPVGRWHALRRLSPPGLGHARPRRPSYSSGRCSPATGRSCTPPSPGTSARRPAWWRRTSSGTSSAACAPWSYVER